MSQEHLLTTDEVSEILGVSKSTLASWRRSRPDDLPFIQDGRFIRYRESDVDEFIDSFGVDEDDDTFDDEDEDDDTE